jgi:GAF domain-containing protein
LPKQVAIGAIFIRRTEVRPFTEKQIKLLETFASQSVIAIENVRLFNQLQERTRKLVRSAEELKARDDQMDTAFPRCATIRFLSLPFFGGLTVNFQFGRSVSAVRLEMAPLALIVHQINQSSSESKK